jgi:minichromosome maintenance protein 10
MYLEIVRNMLINSERKLPHDTVQAHMYGRYYLPPSLLYSVIRLSRDGATYDVPVEGDWVTIAVVAEKSDIRVSGGGGGGGASRAEDNDTSEDEAPVKRAPERGDFSLASPSKKTYQKPKGKDARSDYKRRKPKKYVNLKLAALPSRTKMASVPGAGGDAILQLLLFQAESVVKSEEVDEDGKAKVTYAGGSGGAFERWANLGVGDVVGIISPRILRPLKVGLSLGR